MKESSQKAETPLTASLHDNCSALRRILDSPADLVERRFTLQSPAGRQGVLYYFDGIVDGPTIQASILEAIHRHAEAVPDLQTLARQVLNTGDARTVDTLEQAFDGMFNGLTLLLLDGADGGLLLNTIGGPVRSISEPSTEPVLRGPRDGFTENMRTNTALIRRRLHNPMFRIHQMTVGRRSKTLINLVYLEDLVKEGLIEEIKQRINRIDIDAILGSGYIEELIDDTPLSPFVTTQSTERPDKVASALLEGRAAILVNNTPFAILVPATFWMFTQAADDYYSRYYVGSFFRVIRIAAMLISLTLPSIYVLISTFHHEMMPTSLALTIAAGREVVPFPVLFEVLLMELFFELMREAGLRMPKPIGSAVSIVGSLVIGQAAVQAGIVGPFAVIVVAITGISSFAMPNYALSFSMRLIRFPLVLASGTMGLLGFGAVLVLLMLHLLSLKSFGEPYMAPLTPFRPSEQKDIIIRIPWWAMKKRPRMARGDALRQQEQARPDPPPRTEEHEGAGDRAADASGSRGNGGDGP